MKSKTSFSRYSSQVARPPVISGYVYSWVTRSIWPLLRFFGFLVKILRSDFSALKLQLGPILCEITFFSSLSTLVTYLWIKLDFKPISQQPFLIWSDIFQFLGFYYDILGCSQFWGQSVTRMARMVMYRDSGSTFSSIEATWSYKLDHLVRKMTVLGAQTSLICIKM